MRSKKTYVIFITILIIFATAMYFLVAKQNIKEEKELTTLLVGNTSIWNCSNKKWLNVTKLSTIDKLNWLKFNIYEDGDYIGKYSVWYDTSKWYFFDKKNNSLETNGKVLASKSNYDIKIDKFNEEKITSLDKKYIDYVLEENKLSTSSKFTSSYKIDLDFDHDKYIETFYVISNAFPTEFEPDQIFSIVFMVKEDSVYYLYKEIDDNKVNNGCKPYFNYFLDLNEDKKDEIILSCGKYSDKGTVDMLYKFEDNEFKIKISNQ